MAGTYLAVKPDAFAIADIQKIQNRLHLNGVEKQELHCTLMYSPDAEGSGYEPKPEVKYTASVVGADFYGGDSLVLLLHCPALQRRHNYAKSCGLVPTFPNYSPHITIAKGENLDAYLPDLRQLLANSNQLEFSLSKEIMEPIKPKEPEAGV